MNVYFSYHPKEWVFIRFSRWYVNGICIEIGPWMWLISRKRRME